MALFNLAIENQKGQKTKRVKPKGSDSFEKRFQSSLTLLVPFGSFGSNHAGHKADLCGGYRHGFAGTTSFALKDYRIHYNRVLASFITIYLIAPWETT